MTLGRRHASGGDAADAAGVVVRTLLGRRSVRSGYSTEPVDEHLLEQVVACGLAAPSSKDARPWRLHVVSDPGLLAGLADLVDAAEGADSYVPHDPATGRPHPQWASTVAESAEVLRQVPAAIFVENCGPFSHGRRSLAAASHEGLVGSLVGYTFEVVGLGAAVQNMWTAANALGLAAAFMGDVVIAEERIAAALGLTGDLIGVLALGRLADGGLPPAQQRADPARVVWHRDRR